MRIYKGDDFIGYRPKSHSTSVPGFKIFLSFYSRASMILFLSQSTTPALPLTRILVGVVKTCCFSSLRLEINQWEGSI